MLLDLLVSLMLQAHVLHAQYLLGHVSLWDFLILFFLINLLAHELNVHREDKLADANFLYGLN
jgi:hypothetical protein